jgi:tellurite resistance protein TerC
VEVPAAAWWLTIAGIVALLVFDYVVHVRRSHVPTLGE